MNAVDARAEVVASVLSPRFSSLEVATKTGVSLRQLQWWDEQGVVTPVQHGRRRLYSPGEVLMVGIIVSLRRKRLSLQKIRRIFADLDGDDALDRLLISHDRSSVFLLTDGLRVVLESSPEAIVDVLKQAEKPLLAVCVSDVIKALGLESFGSRRKPVHTETGLAGSQEGLGRTAVRAS